jgi:hypothetical protein
LPHAGRSVRPAIELARDDPGPTEDDEMSEYTFDLILGDRCKVVTVEASDDEEAQEAIEAVRDRDFPGYEIEDHVGR